MSDIDDDMGEDEDQGPYIGEYEGERNEKEERHGQGKTILPNKDLYQGSYVHGKRDGYGVYKFKAKAAKGARYSGEYFQGKKQGLGVFIYPDGSKYEGNWVNDLKDGTGKYYYINGDVYNGDWKQGQRHGKGTYTFAKDGSKYTGSWRKGKWEGFGEYKYANFKYCGRFRDNKMFGHGKFVFDTACELHGQFVSASREKAGAQDIDAEAFFVTQDGAGDQGEGDGDGEESSEPLRMPPSPPPLDGPTYFITGQLTGLHVMTPEEEEEARLVEDLNKLRSKVEAQIAAKKEAQRKRAEARAARRARQEAEMAALEAQAEEATQGGEGEGEGEDGGRVATQEDIATDDQKPEDTTVEETDNQGDDAENA